MGKRKSIYSDRLGPSLKNTHKSFEKITNPVNFDKVIDRPENLVKSVMDGPSNRHRDLDKGYKLLQTKSLGPKISK